jgi:hypothetical protein
MAVGAGRDSRLDKVRQGGGIHAFAEEVPAVGDEGVATLGGSWMGTLRRPGNGMRTWSVDGGPRRHHDLSRSHRLTMASTWEIDVGGGASLRAPDMTWRLWIILSSGMGAGMVQ